MNLLQKIKKQAITYHKLIIYIVLIAFMIYAFLSVILKATSMKFIFSCSFFFVFFLFGALLVGHKLYRNPPQTVVIRLPELALVFIAVVLTYEISFLLELSAVLVSALVGLLGYVLIEKKQMAIYCGSFAGMISPLLMNHLEVLLLALITSIMYEFIKKILDGFGGRLGTIAFVSSTITSLILGKETLALNFEFKFYLVIIFAVGGAMISYYLQHNLSLSSVVASSLPSALMAVILIYIFPSLSFYAGIFFTASFLGMSGKNTIINLLNAFFVGFILSIIYLLFLDHFNGFGGKMGLMALVSVIINYGIIYLYRYLVILLKKDKQRV